MRVRATLRGFYGVLREPGEEFEIAGNNGFSERWMEKVRRRKPAPEPDVEPEADEGTD